MTGSKIYVKPPSGAQTQILAFENLTTTSSSTDRAGSFGFEILDTDGSQVNAYPRGTDVLIFQDDMIFRGYIDKVPVSVFATIRKLSITGVSYSAKTQEIIVNETFEETEIGDILSALFTAYMPIVGITTYVEACAEEVSLNFSDAYLWDAMEQLASLAGYNWAIRQVTTSLTPELELFFYAPENATVRNELSDETGNYEKNSANFYDDASNFVNKLTVIGGTGTMGGPTIDDWFVDLNKYAPLQSGTGSGTLTHKPKRGYITSLKVGESPPVYRTVGILGSDNSADYHLFVDQDTKKIYAAEAGYVANYNIYYSYDFPIKFQLNNLSSQTIYGTVEKIYTVKATSMSMARKLAQSYLDKNSVPIKCGSIKPHTGTYYPGDIVPINLTQISINENYTISQVNLSSQKGGKVTRTLTLAQSPKSVSNIIKDINRRLRDLETPETGVHRVLATTQTLPTSSMRTARDIELLAYRNSTLLLSINNATSIDYVSSTQRIFTWNFAPGDIVGDITRFYLAVGPSGSTKVFDVEITNLAADIITIQLMVTLT